MNNVKIELENCYGIKKLEKEFNFTTEKNVNVVYAKNGLMKTSFAKVFKMFQLGESNKIKDMIHNSTPAIKNIKVDSNDILSEEIFVINSFEKAYESNSISTLLINDDIKARLQEIIRIKNEIFNNLKNRSGLDLAKVYSTKGFLKLEEQIIKDFNFTEKSFLQNCESIDLESIDYDYSDVNYSTLFHKAVLKNIKKDEFQQYIEEYITRSEEIYDEYTFFESGRFNLPKLKDIKKELEKSNFFVRENAVSLNGSIPITDISDVQAKILEVESRLQNTPEFIAIDRALSTREGKLLKDVIENRIDIIEELYLDNLDSFRKKLWLSYLNEDAVNFNLLKVRYAELREEIASLNLNETLWQKAIDIFNNRFNLPFTMDIDNLRSSIIGESLPKVIFTFTDGNGNEVKLDRDELEDGDTLSQGEKRALYLLNIIFDIEKRREENQRTLFIIDDIADSFDYKNKYAIIEYLKDISKHNNFYMIVLSHNFDFYRTISSRLDVEWNKKFHAIKMNDEIKIEKEHYQNRPFDTWKDVLYARTRYHITYDSINAKKHILALIPFVRNLIEFGVEKQVNTFSGIDKDYMLLTNLLHLKDNTNDIEFNHIKDIYQEYIGESNFDPSINNTDKVYDMVISIADNNISDDDINLENKIIIAIAIRLKAEEFMINEIQASSDTFTWKRGSSNQSGNQVEFLNYIKTKGNQTRELFNGFAQIGTNVEVALLDSVNIMTPENIHLNSFMYEPLLDMDIVELKRLYGDVKNLFMTAVTA